MDEVIDMNEENKAIPYPSEEMRVKPVLGEPVDVWDQINKYGTYEVQDTTDTDNVFPTIGPEGGWRNCLDLPDVNPKKRKKTEP